MGHNYALVYALLATWCIAVAAAAGAAAVVVQRSAEPTRTKLKVLQTVTAFSCVSITLVPSRMVNTGFDRGHITQTRTRRSRLQLFPSCIRNRAALPCLQ